MTQNVRIFKPAKTATQSGRAKTRHWQLEYLEIPCTSTNPLMGWNQSSAMQTQVHLAFDTLERAIAYAEAKGLQYIVHREQPAAIKPKNYADNFRRKP